MGNDEVYVVLTATGTWLGRTIQWVTKAPLSHASLSFDRQLNDAYSFGRKKLNNPFVAGFVQENFAHPFFKDAPCAVFRVPIGSSGFERMRRRIEEMKKKQDCYKYHLLGLIGVLIRRRIPRENAYFCSQFVASVLEDGGCRPLDKPTYFTKPEDFELAFSSQLVYRGTVSGYLERFAPTKPVAASSVTLMPITA